MPAPKRAACLMTRIDPDAPYEQLAALPRTLWLPAVTSSSGDTARRLADLARWRDALHVGELPGSDADFGDPAAMQPLRGAVAALGLPLLVRTAPALAEQVLRTMLWHLDRLIDRMPTQSRSDAIARMVAEFSAEWAREKGDWEALLALLQGLGDLSSLRWDDLQGLLRQRERKEWREIERLSALLRSRPELTALIRRAGPRAARQSRRGRRGRTTSSQACRCAAQSNHSARHCPMRRVHCAA